VVVVLLGERFFVLEERSVVFFDFDFTVVLVGFETVLLTVLAGVFLVDAIASIRGAGFLAGLVARTARIALVCSSSVIRNS
jgi:hypothetical protein